MEIQYVLINFLILVGIVVLFCRKIIVGLFRGRRERILRELDEAEQLEKLETPVMPEPVFTSEVKVEEDKVAKEKKVAEEKIAQVRNLGQRECNEIHRIMIDKTRKRFLQILRNRVVEIFAEEPYRSKMQAKVGDFADKILEVVELTPGDMAYIKKSNVLNVTLTSAYPLEPELIKKIEDKVTKMLDEVGSNISFAVTTDTDIVGGLRLQIGDTVYETTVVEEFYHFEKRILRNPVSSAENLEEELLLHKAEFESMTEKLEMKVSIYQLGRVTQISDGICWMNGLADIMYGEVVEFECGERGMILDIQPERIGCVVFGSYENIDSNSLVRRVGRIASVPVGEALLGRVVDAIGNPLDGEGNIFAKEKRPIECKAPGILDRSPVNQPLHTGLKAVDALVPIGKGQRELIIGDRQTGKTAIAIDAIINQKGKDTICIYVAIGQKETTIAEIKDKLEKHGAMEYTIIVAAPAAGSAATQYIAPFSGTAMAEYFMYAGKDVLIIYDDLSKHAVAYRELSLLLHRPSGREAYPGDIFYLHSRLLERAAHLSEELGGGSITALPIIETLAGDISAYIPTNVISITDGQIFLESDLFHEGQRPAINVGLSVSRVGGAAQTKLLKQMAASLRTKLAQYRELADFTQLGSDVDDTTKRALNSGAHLMEVLKQNRYQPMEDWKQALLLFAVSEGYADEIALDEMQEFEEKLFPFFEANYMSLVEILKTGAKANAEVLDAIRSALAAYKKRDK